jgi:hypothetical protein
MVNLLIKLLIEISYFHLINHLICRINAGQKSVRKIPKIEDPDSLVSDSDLI